MAVLVIAIVLAMTGWVYALGGVALKFIQRNWGLAHHTPRIRWSHDFSHVFDFRSRPRPPEPLATRAPATGDAGACR